MYVIYAVKFFVRLPKFSAGLLAQVKENLGNMAENLQADGVQRRKPLVVRYCLKHNILRRMLAGMLAILCVAGSLPANVDGGALLGSTAIVAKAAYTDGTLIVGGTSVTSTTTSGTGWSFNTETNTLTFSEI